MKLEKININTTYMGMHDITNEINDIIDKSGVRTGICHVSVLHSTAGLVIASGKESSCNVDIMDDIERLVPTRVDFKHRETASDAGGHVKTALTGTQITLIIENNKLLLGPEQAVIFAEFDGPRPRACFVGVSSDEN
ncbi:secondary thiamine-phosphate synthase enzyme YjbQ [Bacillus sp. JJ1562]|uniref:secondary thiamine-phosphate synthase enzyme YjbQ n=1 Tax=Bacillus sp. JJ1562 TaxID=3122960 RepID=UPI003003851D